MPANIQTASGQKDQLGMGKTSVLRQ